MKVKISDIRVSERVRRELGDLDGLEESISNIGLLNPIIITRDYHLICGERRLRSCKNLGWSEIDAIMIDESDPLLLLAIETDENLLRKDFNQQEIEEIVKRKQALLRKRQYIPIVTPIVNFFKAIFKAIGKIFKRKS